MHPFRWLALFYTVGGFANLASGEHGLTAACVVASLLCEIIARLPPSPPRIDPRPARAKYLIRNAIYHTDAIEALGKHVAETIGLPHLCLDSWEIRPLGDEEWEAVCKFNYVTVERVLE